jgi:hypothetical protein
LLNKKSLGTRYSQLFIEYYEKENAKFENITSESDFKKEILKICNRIAEGLNFSQKTYDDYYHLFRYKNSESRALIHLMYENIWSRSEWELQKLMELDAKLKVFITYQKKDFDYMFKSIQLKIKEVTADRITDNEFLLILGRKDITDAKPDEFITKIYRIG